MVHIVTNRSSGAGRASEKARALAAELKLLGLDATVHAPTSAQDATSLVRSLPEEVVVVSAGGDGSHRAVAAGCIGTNRTMALLAAGTGNDYAAGLGLARITPAELASAIRQAHVRTVDVGEVWLGNATEPDIFLNAFGMGFDADVAAHLKRIRGAPPLLNYTLSVVKRLPSLRTEHLTVSSEGRELWSEPSILAAALIGKQTGGGFTFAPHADYVGGELHITLGGALTPSRFLKAVSQLLRTVPINVSGVSTRRCCAVQYTWRSAVHAHLDGDPQGKIRSARLGVRTDALQLVMTNH